jgi:hypothetical protein
MIQHTAYVHQQLRSKNVQNLVHGNSLVFFTFICCPHDADCPSFGSISLSVLSFLRGSYSYTDKKEKKIFPLILGNSEGSGAKSYMTNDLLIHGENICAFPHILGSLYDFAPDPI